MIKSETNKEPITEQPREKAQIKVTKVESKKLEEMKDEQKKKTYDYKYLIGAGLMFATAFVLHLL